MLFGAAVFSLAITTQVAWAQEAQATMSGRVFDAHSARSGADQAGLKK
jgi:hypothetical protein